MIRRNDDLSRSAQQRLRAVLGTLGDDTDPPRPFARLVDDPPAHAADRRRPRVWLVPALVLAVVLAVVGLAWRQASDPTSDLVPATPPSATNTTATTAVPGSTLPGPWYRVAGSSVRTGLATSAIGGTDLGAAAWISNDGSWSRVLVLHQLPSAEADRAQRPDGSISTMLIGVDGPTVAAPSGELRFVIDDTQADRQRQMRWTRTDGSRWEFASYGLAPDELAAAIRAIAAAADQSGCPCPLDGFDLVASYQSRSAAFIHQQTIEVGDQRYTLSRSVDATDEFGVGRAGVWASADPRLIAGSPGAVIDDTRAAVWTADGYWFSLWSQSFTATGEPASVDPVLALLQRTDGEPSDPRGLSTSVPTIDAPPTVWPYPTRPDPAVIHPNTPPDPAATAPTAAPPSCVGTYELRVGDSVAAVADRLGVPLDAILALNDLDLSNMRDRRPLNVPCGATPVSISGDRSGLESYSTDPADTDQFEGHNRLILVTDRRVILIDGGTSQGAGAISIDRHDRATAAGLSGSTAPIPACAGPIEITANTDVPLDAVPFTCTTDGTAGTVDAFSSSVTYPS